MSDTNAGCWWNAVQRHLGGYQQRYSVRPVGRLQQGTWQFLLNVGRKEQSPESSANPTPCAQPQRAAGAFKQQRRAPLVLPQRWRCAALASAVRVARAGIKKSPSFDGLFAFQVE
ncbi:hypothetical protein [Comamonas sp.]|uniref:hypothetical protein n=1 Tax=Comamonas sp. TaxID=34028 RepID=UPI0028973AC1|nr:hypothetical protein [Comamonas sp.]